MLHSNVVVSSSPTTTTTTQHGPNTKEDSRDYFHNNNNNNNSTALFHSSNATTSLRNTSTTTTTTISNQLFSSPIGNSSQHIHSNNFSRISIQQPPPNPSYLSSSSSAVHSHLRNTLPPLTTTSIHHHDSTRLSPSIQFDNSSIDYSNPILSQRFSHSTPNYSNDSNRSSYSNSMIGNYHHSSPTRPIPTMSQFTSNDGSMRLPTTRGMVTDHHLHDSLPNSTHPSSSNHGQSQGNSQSYRYHPYQRVPSPQHSSSLMNDQKFIQRTQSDKRNFSSFQNEQ